MEVQLDPHNTLTFWGFCMEWERLEGDELKVLLHKFGMGTSSYSRSIFHILKCGRKTVVWRDHGVHTLYVFGDDGWIWAGEYYSTPTVNEARTLASVIGSLPIDGPIPPSVARAGYYKAGRQPGR